MEHALHNGLLYMTNVEIAMYGLASVLSLFFVVYAKSNTNKMLKVQRTIKYIKCEHEKCYIQFYQDVMSIKTIIYTFDASAPKAGVKVDVYYDPHKPTSTTNPTLADKKTFKSFAVDAAIVVFALFSLKFYSLLRRRKSLVSRTKGM